MLPATIASMPTYEYVCDNCKEHLEIVQSFKDEPLKECPNCGGNLRKVFGSIGIVFKGSGFYKTDNRTSRSKSSKSVTAPNTETSSKDVSTDTKKTSDTATASGSNQAGSKVADNSKTASSA